MQPCTCLAQRGLGLLLQGTGAATASAFSKAVGQVLLFDAALVRAEAGGPCQLQLAAALGLVPCWGSLSSRAAYATGKSSSTVAKAAAAAPTPTPAPAPTPTPTPVPTGLEAESAEDVQFLRGD